MGRRKSLFLWILAYLHHSTDSRWGFWDEPSKSAGCTPEAHTSKYYHIPSARYAAYVCWIALSDSRLCMHIPSSFKLGKTQVRKLSPLRLQKSSFKASEASLTSLFPSLGHERYPVARSRSQPANSCHTVHL
jgi:hypothetical protein